ncbi:hypothetical protein SAMN05892883_2760 [Jatrophihabitans sp. GAS493]|uniref:hypothetical protein n=1 Tax=Jatrophihabitans sp. GAS493 TaxID=1907575 RepID=UPI000BC06F39|nr:hypothetical protein [Jatrophihabitans sp. GAS493]SOD73464.1 hypothetical protein SAMN05892883_2760 [Jatrophihabitans sp. GAS493]
MRSSHVAPTSRVPQDVDLWLDGDEPIMLRAFDGNDPVELTAQDAKDLAVALLELADRAEDSTT